MMRMIGLTRITCKARVTGMAGITMMTRMIGITRMTRVTRITWMSSMTMMTRVSRMTMYNDWDDKDNHGLY